MRSNADWFRDAKWGLFMHFLAARASGGAADFDVAEWNRQVDAFDVERLAAQCEEVGADRSPKSRYVDGALYHVLSYLGRSWGRGSLRFPDELVVSFTKHANGVGGVVTWDVPVGERGTLDDATMRQLAALRAATRS